MKVKQKLLSFILGLSGAGLFCVGIFLSVFIEALGPDELLVSILLIALVAVYLFYQLWARKKSKFGIVFNSFSLLISLYYFLTFFLSPSPGIFDELTFKTLVRHYIPYFSGLLGTLLVVVSSILILIQIIKERPKKQ